MLEEVRRRLRGLVGLIETGSREPLYSNFDDEILDIKEVDRSKLLTRDWTSDYRPRIGVSGILQDYINNPSLLDGVQWLVDARFVFERFSVPTVEDDDLTYADFGLFSSSLGGDNDDFWGHTIRVKVMNTSL